MVTGSHARPWQAMCVASGLYALLYANGDYRLKMAIFLSIWRMGWDSNPRGACTPAGFQDRCLNPLGHPSDGGVALVGRRRRLRC